MFIIISTVVAVGYFIPFWNNLFTIILNGVVIAIGSYLLIVSFPSRKETQGGNELCNESSGVERSSIDFLLPNVIRMMLQYCWGMTMNFSHLKQQQDLGEKLNSEFLRLTVKEPDELSVALISLLSKTFRNLAFAREAHVRYLQHNAWKYQQKEKFLQSVSGLWTSKESIPIKVISFFATGAGFDLLVRHTRPSVKEILDTYTGSGNNASGNNASAPPILEQIQNLNVSPETKEVIVSEVSSQVSQSFDIQEVLLFIILGVAGMLLVSFLLLVYSKWRLSRELKKVKEDQNNYWKNTYLKDMSGILYYLYLDIIDELKQYAELSYLLSLPGDKEIKDNEEMIKDWIRCYILPSCVNIEWTMWIEQNKPLNTPIESASS